MESIHKPDTRSWIGKSVNVKRFRDEWSYSLSKLTVLGSGSGNLLQASNIPEEVISRLQKECSAEMLDCKYEDHVEVTKSFTIPEGVNLKTLKSQKADTDKRNTNKTYRLFVYNNSKFNNYPSCETAKSSTASVSEGLNRVDLPEVVLTVQIYRPEKALRRYQSQVPPRIPTFLVDQEFFVLGCQYLTELRDKITCVSDFAVPGEFSANPYQETNVTCKDLMKSGFFYIHGVFYNDMRDPSSKDYSNLIIQWAESSDRGIGPFSSTSMETAQFIDLEIRLGYPYVYVHQGHCEHLLVFSDLRMLNADDSHNRADYPMVLGLIPKKRTFCMVCHIHTARWVVYKNKRLPEEPYFFCNECFMSFNYDEDGNKIGEFEAQKYYDRTLL